MNALFKQRSASDSIALVLFGVMASFFENGTGAAELGDPAIHGNHPLTQVQAGELLISELRCTACHSDPKRDSTVDKSAPDLSEAGARISPEYLRRYLTSPLSAHPGTTMPDVLPSKTPEEKDSIAEAITHFLVAQSKTVFQAERPVEIRQLDGKKLYHSVGCVACHGPRESITPPPPIVKRNDEDEDDEQKNTIEKKIFKPIAVNLGHVAAKYSTKSLADFLFQPLHIRRSGRMPDMKLSPAESLAIASYLIGEQPEIKSLVPDERLVTRGKNEFKQLNCAACHSLASIPPAPLVGALKNANLSGGCLSKSSVQSPRFALTDAQTQAIIAAILADSIADSDQIVAAKTLTRFQCIACHIRDDFGGVHEEYSPYFSTSEKNLGEDGRIPPPLTLVGAKLQPTWLKKVLFDGESVRPYMATRMPQYGVTNLHQMPDIFARLDVLTGKDMNIPSPESDSETERERERLLRKTGQQLIGDKGLNCIACHNFNGKPAPVNKGIDLMTSYQRLQPAWFNSFVRNPAAFRPRILMPYAWSNGVAAHKTILDGNTDMQIEAIWYYLSLGTSAADPSGIRGVSTNLTVTIKSRIHRGRSRVAGFRGIAVGFPEKLSYAFNAETGTLSAIWQGEFIGVNWNGQGSGDFYPSTEPVTLAQDVSFVQSADFDSPWPMMPVMTKDAPVNPNPLYPKNLGYQFLGYFLDDHSIPTFKYRIGTIEIEDRSVATVAEEKRKLSRALQLESPTQQTVLFRALTGDVRKESDRVFQIGRLRLTIPQVETKLRLLTDEPKRAELLLRLEIPRGKSNMELLYEPLDK